MVGALLEILIKAKESYPTAPYQTHKCQLFLGKIRRGRAADAGIINEELNELPSKRRVYFARFPSDCGAGNELALMWHKKKASYLQMESAIKAAISA